MYLKTIKQVLTELNTSETGLTNQEVKLRQEKDGYNELPKKEKESLFIKFIHQFQDFMIIILMLAAIISMIANPHDYIDSIIIFVVVLLNAILGVFYENHAEKSLEALNNLTKPESKVIRDGKSQIIKTKDLVVGDILVIEAGDQVGSDARVIESYDLKMDESPLTGESLPVLKTNEALKEEVLIGDQVNMVFASTTCIYGRGKAVVTSIGKDNEVGKIASMLQETKNEKTPLQIKLDEIGKVIGYLCMFICIVVFGLNMLSGLSLIKSFETSIALAVAAIPEGLSATVTIVLSLSVSRMVKKHAIIRKLPAVETLGSTNIVCSDKTGTLTQNKMTIVKTYLKDDQVKDLSNEDIEMINYFTLCSDANIEKEKVGDPTEIALVEASKKLGYEKKELETNYPRLGEIAFDSERKMMSILIKKDNTYYTITKGGPDVVLDRCINKKDIYYQINEQMGKDALRVLALAMKKYDTKPNMTIEEVENNMEFIGFVGMIDPEREEAYHAIKLAKKAGIRTIMITGDHKITASAIAKKLGILNEGEKVLSGAELEAMSDEELDAHIEEYSVYARVAPIHKVRIVSSWQRKNKVVAMTGDGVNDAPALKKADIGCAMGITGTDVSKNAATMILTDDNFATIIEAVKQGRGIFANIKKDVQYLLSSNVGEVVTLLFASIIASLFPHLGFGLPLLPIHLLWVNLITDTLPAFALGLEPIHESIMNEKPRDKNASFFENHLLPTILIQGLLIGIITLISYSFGLKDSHDIGMTMAFITLSGAQLFHSYNVKSRKSLIHIKLFDNKYLQLSFILGVLLQLVIILTPLSSIFHLVNLDRIHWIVCILLAFSIIPINEGIKRVIR